MNRRASDKTQGRDILVKRLQRLAYEDLITFTVPQLQSVVLGLFGRKSPEYTGTYEVTNIHRLAHMICDECDINYPGKFDMYDTIKMVEQKLKAGQLEKVG